MFSTQHIHNLARPKILREETIARAFIRTLSQLHDNTQLDNDAETILMMSQIGSESDCKPLLNGVKHLLSIDETVEQLDLTVGRISAHRQDNGKWAIKAHFSC